MVGVSHGGVPVQVPRYSPPLAVYPAPRIYAPVHVYPRPYVSPTVVYPPIVRYAAPAVIYAAPAVTYVQPPPPQYWYYCNDYQAYYPYVEQCPSEWVPVLPNR